MYTQESFEGITTEGSRESADQGATAACLIEEGVASTWLPWALGRSHPVAPPSPLPTLLLQKRACCGAALFRQLYQSGAVGLNDLA